MTKTVLSPSECAADRDETNIFQDKSEFQYLKNLNILFSNLNLNIYRVSQKKVGSQKV